MLDRIKGLFGRHETNPTDLVRTVKAHLNRTRTAVRHPKMHIILDEIETRAVEMALGIYEKYQQADADRKLHTLSLMGGGGKTWLIVSAVPRNRRDSPAFFASESPPGYLRYVDLWLNSPTAKTALTLGHSVMAHLLLYADRSVGLSVTPLDVNDLADCPKLIFPEESLTKEDKRQMGIHA